MGKIAFLVRKMEDRSNFFNFSHHIIHIKTSLRQVARRWHQRHGAGFPSWLGKKRIGQRVLKPNINLILFAAICAHLFNMQKHFIFLLKPFCIRDCHYMLFLHSTEKGDGKQWGWLVKLPTNHSSKVYILTHVAHIFYWYFSAHCSLQCAITKNPLVETLLP